MTLQQQEQTDPTAERPVGRLPPLLAVLRVCLSAPHLLPPSVSVTYCERVARVAQAGSGLVLTLPLVAQ
jgi:hypothetical protein